MTNKNNTLEEKTPMTQREKVAMFRNNSLYKTSSDFNRERQVMITNFLESGYFESATQELVFKRMLKEIHEALKENNQTDLDTEIIENGLREKLQLSLSVSTYNAYKELINGIKEMFPKSWHLVRFFKYYSGKSILKETTQMDVLNVVIAINKRDRSKFEKLELI